MSDLPYVLPLREARDLSLAGGKAINLAKLMAADLPVPDGFVVTTAAYQEGKGGKLSSKVKTQIRKEYERMGSPMVAARSSATAEDLAEASMAGQYETFLNLGSIEELLEAVSGCWRGMQSERLQADLKEQRSILNRCRWRWLCRSWCLQMRRAYCSRQIRRLDRQKRC